MPGSPTTRAAAETSAGDRLVEQSLEGGELLLAADEPELKLRSSEPVLARGAVAIQARAAWPCP